jgi:hypothetical protein
MMRALRLFAGLFTVGLWGLAGPPGAPAQSPLPPDAPPALQAFDTDLTNTIIDPSELRRGAPKDAIPAIDNPSFVSLDAARDWIAPKEPVIAVEHDGVARAYPLQILTWHEIVNDTIGDTPVAVTFCPLCYSAIAFERRVDGEPVTFGVSGLLRNSDLVMYDRKSETLWQQFTGKAIVGTHAGETLALVPSQLLSLRQFAQNYPDGTVLSRDTGYDRRYGQNPYAGYDDVDKPPFAYDGPTDDRLPPKEKVVAVSLGGTHKAYPHSATRKQHVVHDTIGERPLVVFHAPGPVSALDARKIAASKEVGATGVFDRRVDGRTLRFRYVGDGRFEDTATESVWTIAGRAVEGPLAGTRLDRVPHGDYFAFSWFAFRPDGVLYDAEPES